MHLFDVFPNADELLALEPDELGLRMLPVLKSWPDHTPLQLEAFQSLSMRHFEYRQHEIGEAIIEAWAWLVGNALVVQISRGGGWRLSRRASRLAKEPDIRHAFSARRIPKEALHHNIREDVWSLYHRGKYDTAVFEAMKAVEVAVRDATKFSDGLVGVKLIRAAFAVEGGPLSDVSVDAGERVARMELFAGAIGAYKNPYSHRNVALDDPDEAAEIIMLANHLLRIVDARAEARSAITRTS